MKPSSFPNIYPQNIPQYSTDPNPRNFFFMFLESIWGRNVPKDTPRNSPPVRRYGSRAKFIGKNAIFQTRILAFLTVFWHFLGLQGSQELRRMGLKKILRGTFEGQQLLCSLEPKTRPSQKVIQEFMGKKRKTGLFVCKKGHFGGFPIFPPKICQLGASWWPVAVQKHGLVTR